MVVNGWHPNQVEEIFIEMGHAADGETIQPPLSEVMTVEDHPERKKQTNTPTYRYMANPFDNLKAAKLTIQANPILIVIWILSGAGAIIFGILSYLLGVLVLNQFAAIALFGFGFSSPLQITLFLILGFMSFWAVFGVYWNIVRAIQIRALLLAMQNKPISRTALFNGSVTSALRLIGGTTILVVKVLLALFIPIITGSLLSPAAMLVGFFIGIVLALLIAIRNIFLPYVLVAEFNISLWKSSQRAYHLLHKPKDKSFEILGWVGLSAILGAGFTVLSALVENGADVISLTGVSFLAATISIIGYVLLSIVQDAGLARLYLGALSLENNNEAIPRAHLEIGSLCADFASIESISSLHLLKFLEHVEELHSATIIVL